MQTSSPVSKRLGRSSCCASEGQGGRWKEIAKEALRLDPSYVKAQKIRAKAHGAAGNWKEAVQDYKAVAEANPTEKGIQEEIRKAEFELKKAESLCGYYNPL